MITPWKAWILCFFLTWYAQAQKIAFKNYSVVNGMPSSEVYKVYQDTKGYIWFCTDAGVCRYDGYNYKTYTNENGLPGNTVFDLYEDRKGRMWFFDMSKKLSYYDPVHDSIYIIGGSDILAKALRNTSITAIYVSPGDTIYMGVNSGNSFYRVLPAGHFGIVQPFLFKTNGWQIYGFPGSEIIWGTTNIMAHGAEPYPLQITQYGKGAQLNTRQFPDFKTFSSNRYRFFAKAAKGFYFVEDNELYYRTKDTLFHRHIGAGSIISLYVDREQNVWCGVRSDGVLKFAGGNIQAAPVRYLEKQSVTSVLQDREGGYWFSTLEHAVYYAPSFVFTFYDQSCGLSGSKVYSVMSYNNSILCFTEDKLLNVIRDSTVQVMKDVNGIRAYDLRNSTGDILITNEDSYFFNFRTKKRQSVFFSPKKEERFFIRKASVVTGHEITAIYSDGICSIDTLSARAQLLATGIMHVTSVYAEGDNIWFGSPGGLYRLCKGKIDYLGKRHRLLKNRIDDIVEDRRHNLWFATKGAGIIIKHGNYIKQLSIKNGLSSNLCKTLLIDSTDVVWVGTNRGISKIRIIRDTTYEIENYSNIHGLLSDEVNQICRLGNFIYAATNQGVVKFDKNLLYANKTPPLINITGLYVNEVAHRVDSLWELPYDQNSLRIHVLGLSFKNPGNLTYKYRLLGLDSAWKYTKNTAIQFTTLPPANYRFEVYAINHDGVISKAVAHVSFAIKNPFWKSVWFIVAGVAFVCLLLYGLYTFRVKRIREIEEEKTALNKKIAEVELKAIRAQMNPHFIFNSINSIQHYILTNDSDMAYRYLSKFSKLIRNVLENSKYELISLKKEIETIELYIEIEKLRFETKFNHKVYVDPTLDVMLLSISPLLIQPYVENAIWHGLMHKKTPGQLNIYFLDENELIRCVIEDDGVGREKAMMIQANNFKKHKSIAISLNKERLDIIGKLFNNKLQVSIYDIELEDRTPCGTRVELFIPKVKYTNYDTSDNS